MVTVLNKKYLEQLLDGSLEDKGTYLVGKYEGYNVIMDKIEHFMFVRINATSDEEIYEDGLTSFLNTLAAETKQLVEANVVAKVVLLKIALPAFQKKYPEVINDIVIKVIRFLRGRQYESGCGNCGSIEKPTSLYLINGMHHILCEDCASGIHDAFEARQEDVLSKKSNVISGTVGALLGALVGVALWVIIYKLGYIAGIAGCVTAVLAIKGYEKLGNVLDRKGIIISVAVTIAAIYFANKLAWSWEAYDVFKEYGATFFDCFKAIEEILEESELKGSYFGDLGIGYLFTLIASAGYIIKAFKVSSGSFTMKKE